MSQSRSVATNAMLPQLPVVARVTLTDERITTAVVEDDRVTTATTTDERVTVAIVWDEPA